MLGGEGHVSSGLAIQQSNLPDGWEVVQALPAPVLCVYQGAILGNHAAHALAGYDAGSVPANWLKHALHEAPQAWDRLLTPSRLEPGTAFLVPWRKADGTRVRVELTAGQPGQAVYWALKQIPAAEDANRGYPVSLPVLLADVSAMAYRVRTDRDWIIEFTSQGCKALTGFDPEYLIGKSRSSYEALIDPADRPRVRHEIGCALESGQPFRVRYRITTADGAAKWVYEKGRAIRAEAGCIHAIEGVVEDVSAQMVVEEALRRSEARFRCLVDTSTQMVWHLGASGQPVDSLEPVERFTGLPASHLRHKPWNWLDIVHPADRDATRWAFDRAIAEGSRFQITHRVRRHDGAWRVLELQVVPVRNDDGSIREWIGAHTDITERVQANRTLELLANMSTLLGHDLGLDQLLERLSVLTRGSIGDTCVIEIVVESQEPKRAVTCTLPRGLRREQALATVMQASSALTRRAVERNTSWLVPQVVDSHWRELSLSEEQIERTCCGTVSMLTVPLRAQGMVLGAVSFFSHDPMTPLTHADRQLAEELAGRAARALEVALLNRAAQSELVQRRHAQEALRETEQRLQLALDAAQLGIYSLNLDTGAAKGSNQAAAIFGYAPGQVQTVQDYLDRIHPEDLPAVQARLQAFVPGGPVQELEFRAVRPDGTMRWVRTRGRMIDAPGPVLGVLEDVTARRQLEEQLRQSQKMEAVGRLAGGVAHDFNNLLTVIRGTVDFLEAGATSENHDWIADIKRASDRAAALTRQLLAFSRRHVVTPQDVQVNELVSSAEKMLRRLISEDVQLVTRLAPHLPCVHIDPNQLEQALVNLVVNARDATPPGGSICVSSALVNVDDAWTRRYPQLPRAQYVVLTVSDTGEGMSEETQRRIFEPFFTTKAPGKGTGLGLSTVFGIMQQAGGFVTVDSRVGQGSSLKLYLPPVLEEAGAVHVDPSLADVHGGNETILLVEDEPQVRRFSCRALQQRGYSVMGVATGAEAIARAARHSGPIHLVVSDVVLPGMSGPEMIDVLRARWPQIKVLYMTGYAAEALSHPRLREGIPLLEKPFSADGIATAVRRALDAPASADAPAQNVSS